MERCHISIRDVKAYRITAGVKLVVTTDIPCHLYMRWSLVPPQAHTVPALRRGLWMHGDRYYCFVAYHDNQQQESGDTLTHSFIKVPWPVCERRYFYFWGKVGTNVCASNSPCFQLHLEEEVPPQVHEYQACRHNRFIRSTHGTWSTARNGFNERKSGHYQRPDNYLQAFTEAIGMYDIDRAYLNFPTLPLLAGPDIVAGQLGLFVTEVGLTNALVFISKGLWDEPVVPEDFVLQTDETTDLGHMATGDMVIGQYNWIDLNQAGLDWISQRPLEINQFESYDWLKSAYLLFYPPYWRSESFTPQSSHTLTKVRLRLRRQGSPGILNIHIRAADASHLPTGPDLATGSIDGNSLITTGWGDWYLIDLGAGAALAADSEYCVILEAPGSNSSNYVEWLGATASEYPNGTHSLSSDNGSTWSPQATQDGYFIEYESAEVGGTKFCLRMYGDHQNIVPAPNAVQQVRFYSAQKGEPYLPLLRLTLG